jgi:hypothetical protein
MTKKRRIRNDMLMLAQALNGCIDDQMPYPMAKVMFGNDLLKKARQREIVTMDPDPHDGRTSRTVGQRVMKKLPGWMGGGKDRIKKETVTTVRYGQNVVPEMVTLTDAGRQMVTRKEKGA